MSSVIFSWARGGGGGKKKFFSGRKQGIDLVMYIDNKMDSLSSLKSIKRHYKKDSRYVNDLYTLTYDNHESLDTVELISSLYFRTDITDDVSVLWSILAVFYAQFGMVCGFVQSWRLAFLIAVFVRFFYYNWMHSRRFYFFFVSNKKLE